MDWITPQIAIGNHIDARDAALIQRERIRCVISLDGSVIADEAAACGLMEVATHRLIDGAGNDPRVFKSALANLDRMVAAHPPVLVHCHAGRSRSVILVAAYLMRHQNLDAEEAIARIAAKRAVAVSPELMRLLRNL